MTNTMWGSKMPLQNLDSQIEDIHTLIKEIGLVEMKLSSRIRRLEDRMLYTQQAVRTIQLEKDGDSNDIMAKRNKRSK